MFTKFQNTNEKYLECHYLIKPSTHKAKNKKKLKNPEGILTILNVIF